jgi:hypothetical protein
LTVYFFGINNQDKILEKDGVLAWGDTNEEFSIQVGPERTANVPVGTRFIKIPFTVHPTLDLVLLILAIFSTIGAFFEVLAFFSNPKRAHVRII